MVEGVAAARSPAEEADSEAGSHIVVVEGSARRISPSHCLALSRMFYTPDGSHTAAAEGSVGRSRHCREVAERVEVGIAVEVSICQHALEKSCVLELLTGRRIAGRILPAQVVEDRSSAAAVDGRNSAGHRTAGLGSRTWFKPWTRARAKNWSGRSGRQSSASTSGGADDIAGSSRVWKMICKRLKPIGTQDGGKDGWRWRLTARQVGCVVSR